MSDLTGRIEARIIGLGNRLRGDDAVGPIVAVRAAASGRIPAGVEAVEVWGDPLELLDLITSCRKAVIVDAAEMGEPPGTVRILSSDEMIPHPGTHMTLHTIGLTEVMAIARKLGADTQISLLAVQPAACDHSGELSTEVEAKLSEITSLALKEVLK